MYFFIVADVNLMAAHRCASVMADPDSDRDSGMAESDSDCDSGMSESDSDRDSGMDESDSDRDSGMAESDSDEYDSEVELEIATAYVQLCIEYV